ncbi:MAG: ribosome silencing factor [Hyphomonadaceae bacterium]
MKRAPAANTAEKPAASAERDPKRPAPGIDVEAATRVVLNSLDDDKAEEIISIDIRGKSSFADMLVVASGRSARHVAALADHVMRKLKEAGVNDVRVEGLPQADWVLVDAGDVVVHLFRPEVRAFYNIEKIWSGAHTTPLPS